MELNPTAGIKRSNRLYARILADIDRALPRGKISPTERRILLELLSRPASTDAEIACALGIDRAQLSRSIKKLLSDGLIGFKASGSHRAQRLLNLSDEGMSMAAAMDKDVDRAIESVYLKLSSEDQNILLRAVGSEAAADPHREGGGEITFQAPNASDFHYLLGELPLEGKQLGWGDNYVANIAGTIHEFIRLRFADTQMGWMAYQAYKPVGACLLVGSEDGMEARIGVLYVARTVRLRGVGRKLLENATSLAEKRSLLRVSAVAAERQSGLDVLYRKLGYIRSRQSLTDYRFGAMDVWRSYERKFPLMK